MKHLNNFLRIFGIITCLLAAYLMAFGEPIIGRDHTGVATVVLITGIGLLSTGNTISILGKKKEGI